MKKVLSTALLLTLGSVLVLTGCGTAAEDTAAGGSTSVAAPEDDGLLQVAFLTASLSNENWQTLTDAAIAQAGDYGMEVTVTDCAGNSATQVEQMESSIEAGYDIILVAPQDTNALIDAAGRAKKAGIPVVSCDGYFENCAVVVGADEYNNAYELGKKAAEWVNENLADKDSINVASLSFDFVEVCIERKNGYMDGLKDNADMKVNLVADVSPKTAAEATEMSESFLQADDIDVCMACTGDYIYGFSLASDSLGKDAACFTMDGTPSSMRLLAEGKYVKALSTWGTADEKAKVLLDGCKAASEIDMSTFTGTEDEVEHVYYDLTSVDESNVAEEIVRYGWDKE